MEAAAAAVAAPPESHIAITWEMGMFEKDNSFNLKRFPSSLWSSADGGGG